MSAAAVSISDLRAVTTATGLRVISGRLSLTRAGIEALLKRLGAPVSVTALREDGAELRGSALGGALAIVARVRLTVGGSGRLALDLASLTAGGLPIAGVASRFLGKALAGRPGVHSVEERRVVFDLPALAAERGVELPPVAEAGVEAGWIRLRFGAESGRPAAKLAG